MRTESVVDGFRYRSDQELRTVFRAARAPLTGQRFGRLEVLRDFGPAAAGYRWWGCRCDCGVQLIARSRELLRGHTRSCGCYSSELLAGRGGRNKLPFGRASGNELLASYKKSALDRGFAWALSDAEFFALVTGSCTYCGTSRNKERRPNKGVNGGFMYTGIDRIDSSGGYEPSNAVSCCWDCNRAKGTLSAGEFSEWVSRLVRFQTGART